MFRFSEDEFTANKQKEEATALLESLLKYFVIEHSPKIEKFFDENVKTYEFLEELPKFYKTNNYPIVIPCIPHNLEDQYSRMDLSEGYQAFSKSWREITVPFIEFSFPPDYKCKHGISYMHVYIFFFTKFTKFEEAQDCVLHYLNKFNNLKVFL